MSEFYPQSFVKWVLACSFLNKDTKIMDNLIITKMENVYTKEKKSNFYYFSRSEAP